LFLPCLRHRALPLPSAAAKPLPYCDWNRNRSNSVVTDGWTLCHYRFDFRYWRASPRGSRKTTNHIFYFLFFTSTQPTVGSPPASAALLLRHTRVVVHTYIVLHAPPYTHRIMMSQGPQFGSNKFAPKFAQANTMFAGMTSMMSFHAKANDPTTAGDGTVVPCSPGYSQGCAEADVAQPDAARAEDVTMGATPRKPECVDGHNKPGPIHIIAWPVSSFGLMVARTVPHATGVAAFDLRPSPARFVCRVRASW
jgi:hypothetical protein